MKIIICIEFNISCILEFSPSGSDDKTVKTWNVYTGEILSSLDLDSEVKFVRVIGEEKKAVASCNLGNICVIDVNNNAMLRKLQTSHSE